MLTQLQLQELEQTPGRLIVAYSGGCDSHVLLHYLQNNLDHPVEALHVNHGLSDEADAWQHHCESVCDELNVPLSCFAVSVDTAGSLEANARAARYQVFEVSLQAGDLLLMGHHREDQLETIFLNMLSGRALLGIQGMPKRRALGRGTLDRPFLEISREDIRQYAGAEGLQWVEDASNRDTSHDRNYLRAEVLPALASRWPDFARTMADQWHKTAGYLEHLEMQARQDWQDLEIGWDCVSFDGFAELPAARAVALLRLWLRTLGASRMPGSDTLSEGVRVLTRAESESPIFAAAGFQFQRFRSRLVVLPGSRDEVPPDLKLDAEQARFGAGILSADVIKGQGCALPYRQLAFRARRGGEKILVNGHHRSLKNLFQSSGYPPLVRDQVPLVYDGDLLIGIAGITRWGIPMVVADDYGVPEDSPGSAINWSPASDNRYSD